MAENLWAISIDPDESMREYVLLQLKVKPMRDLLFKLANLHLPRRRDARVQGAGDDRQDLGTGA